MWFFTDDSKWEVTDNPNDSRIVSTKAVMNNELLRDVVSASGNGTRREAILIHYLGPDALEMYLDERQLPNPDNVVYKLLTPYVWYPQVIERGQFSNLIYWEVTDVPVDISSAYKGEPMYSELTSEVYQYNKNPEMEREELLVENLGPKAMELVRNHQILPDIRSTIFWTSTRYRPTQMLWYPVDDYENDITIWTLVEPDAQLYSYPEYSMMSSNKPLSGYVSNNVRTLINQNELLPDPSLASNYVQQRMVWIPSLEEDWKWTLIPYSNDQGTPSDYKNGSMSNDRVLASNIDMYRRGTPFQRLPGLYYLENVLGITALNMMRKGFAVPVRQ